MNGLFKAASNAVWSFAVLIAVTSCISNSNVGAQNVTLPQTQPLIVPRDGQKGTSELGLAPNIVARPISCESLATLIDNAIIESHQQQMTSLIIITRLGQGERNSLSKRRIRDIDNYLKRYNSIKTVTAEGSQLEGLGRIELYVAGRLRTVIPIAKNSSTVCSGKVNPFL